MKLSFRGGGFDLYSPCCGNVMSRSSPERSVCCTRSVDTVRGQQELTVAQIAAFSKVFKYFDKDDNGSIAAAEIYSQARSLGLEVSMTQVTGAVAARASRTSHELSFEQFLEILTSTEGYLDALTNSKSPKEAVVFSAVSKYLQTHRSQKTTAADKALVAELDRYFRAKAKVLQPHVIADYAAGNRLIGLTEKQLKHALRKFGQGKRNTHASPYASMPCELRVSTLASKNAKAPLTQNTCSHKVQRAPRQRLQVVMKASQLQNSPESVTRYRTRQIQLPTIKSGDSSPETRRTEVQRAVAVHRKLRDADRLLVAARHWDNLDPKLTTTLQKRFVSTFAAYTPMVKFASKTTH